MTKIRTLAPRVQTLKANRLQAAPSLVYAQRTRGRALQATNRRLFMRNPLCVRCEEKGRAEPVTQWDHKIPLYAGGADTDENKQGLCTPCHVEKTNEDRVRYGHG